MGNNSFTAIGRGEREFVYLYANQLDSSTAANPNKPESYENKRVTSEDSHYS